METKNQESKKTPEKNIKTNFPDVGDSGWASRRRYQNIDGFAFIFVCFHFLIWFPPCEALLRKSQDMVLPFLLFLVSGLLKDLLVFSSFLYMFLLL